MALKLYKMDMSAPVRAVYLTAKALGVTLECAELDLFENEHRKPEFLKLNPQHTIPTLEDNGKIIWDSHAIMTYLVSKYGSDDSLYPNDIYKRAVVNQRLHFDSGVMFNVLKCVVRPIVYDEVKSISQELIDEANEAYDFLEKFLQGHQWVAGDQLTVADFSLVTTATALDVLIPINPNRFPNIIAWIKKMKQLPYYDPTQKCFNELEELLTKLMS